MTTPVSEWKITKDPRGTIPRTVSYTVDPIDGDYTYTVLVLDDKPVCMAHGDDEHSKAVADFIAAKKKSSE